MAGNGPRLSARWPGHRYRYAASLKIASFPGLTSLYAARLVALVSLFRGPLFQRASLIDSNYSYETQGSLKLLIAQHLPEGYSGISVYSRAAGTRDTARLSSAFTQIMNGYASRSDMVLEHEDCGDTCSVVIKVAQCYVS